MTEKILIKRELLEQFIGEALDIGGEYTEELHRLANLAECALFAAEDAAIAAQQQEPVGEEVEVVGYASTVVPEDTPLMTVTQHQRIVDGLKAEVERLQATCDGLDRQNDGLYLELEQAVEKNAKLQEALKPKAGYRLVAVN